MKRAILIVLTIGTALAFLATAVLAEDIPSGGPAIQQPGGSHSAAQQKLFYGYVPPPPIRHTWPGGYRVILHELTNTLMDHMRGWY
jgi:hypothetical protein